MSTRTRRRTTVHDLASLRVHPDGSRVQNIAPLQDGEIPGVSSQTSLRASKYIAQDARGNWIARDAGGAGVVKQKYRKGDKGKGKAIDLDDGGIDEEIAVEDEESVRDSRALKRRKFLHDYSFLGSSGIEDDIPSSSAGEPSSSTLEANVPQALPIPSSDLLKCVHYFASEYYAAHGQLSDVAKEARKEAKMIKMQRIQEDPSKGNDVLYEEEVPNLGEGDAENEEHGEDATTTTEAKPKRRGGRKAGKKWADGRIRRDMYKAFDGSALMVIGMLLQEHVAETMSVTPPEGWEEQMEEAEAQASVERQVKGGKRRRKKDNRRMVELEHEKGDGDISEQREDLESSNSESSPSSSSSSSSSEISSTESDDDSDSESSD